MLFDASRRNLLRGKIKALPIQLRPPWSIEESAFLDACTRCGECLTHCPEKILITDRESGYPRVDFNAGECTFCRLCVEICPSGALNSGLLPPWTAKARIDAGCLTTQQVVCHTCGDVCETRAIRFKSVAGVVPRPIINTTNCTGCGACVTPCPTQSIEVNCEP